MDIHNSFMDILNCLRIKILKYPKIIMDILNYLRISINELWISKILTRYRFSH